MNHMDDLIESYSRFVKLPWPKMLAPAQRVWMAVYSPNEERRLRLHLPAFETATRAAGYNWEQIEIAGEFEKWMAGHDYADAYFNKPELLKTALPGFFEYLAETVITQIDQKATETTIFGLVGASSLYGLGPSVKVSALVEKIEDHVPGRLLVFFPGEVEGNNFRLMGAQDGWNYHAVIISAEGN